MYIFSEQQKIGSQGSGASVTKRKNSRKDSYPRVINVKRMVTVAEHQQQQRRKSFEAASLLHQIWSK